jgi:N-acetylglucosamine-6-phosphate deacetylase
LGVVASAGHTDAGEKHISAAMDAGLSTITHTYNAQRGLHHREIGVVGSALLYDELYAEAICDLIHLSVPAIKLLLKNKPKDKFVLITDSMRAKHLSDGISELGGQKVIVKNGEARLENGALAGSILKMNDAIKNLVTVCGVSLTDAADFASANPAKNLKVFDEQGSIAMGKKANFAVLDDEFNVALTIREGNVIYRP